VRLVLWDIDGTLVHTAGHGRYAFAEAYEHAFGRPPGADIDDVPMAGRTDQAIALDYLGRTGDSEPESHLPRMLDGLHTALAARGDAIAAEGATMPGVREALEELRERDDVLQSLLTGNIERNARIKLAAFGLDGLVDFRIGAFGSDHIIRPELVGIALRKVREILGIEIAAQDVLLIGDTPFDVGAAHDNGARAIAVATGPFTRDQLEHTGAEAVLEDLSDLSEFLAAANLGTEH
jgi:phosphoglycolate phosphatase-like HAD superfamily hydrolase